MEHRSTFLGLGMFGMVAAALLALLPHSRERTEARRTPAESPARTPAIVQSTGEYREGARLLAAFCGTALAPDGSVRCGETHPALNVLLAALPDPYDSHQDYAYDAQLEALRRAFEATGYVIDRFSMPNREDSVVTSTRAGTERRLRREIEPSVLLFRHKNSAPGQTSLYLVYLLSEVPTSGIYKEQMRSALQERAQLLRAWRAPAHVRDTIRMVGPSFSGSALSVRRVLDDWRDGARQPAFSFLSGSATSSSNLDLLDNASLGLRFRATVNPNEALEAAFDTAVGRMFGRARVALLQEQSTQFSQDAFQTGSARGITRLVIPFPMNIGSLRTEYERSADDFATSAPPSLGSPARIPLSLQDPTRARETPAVLSAATPAALDLVMHNILTALRQNQVDAVGIVATDVRDKLFLADAIRRELRDVQLFLFESELLYLHKKHRKGMHGAVVISSYPLFLRNQAYVLRDRTDETRIAFPSDAAQGTFNATLLHLDNESKLMEYGWPGSDATSDRAPVWITAVGNHGFVPLRADTPNADLARRYMARVNPPAFKASTSASESRWYQVNIGTTAFFAALLLLTLLFGLPLLCLQGNRRLEPARIPRIPVKGSVPPALQGRWRALRALSTDLKATYGTARAQDDETRQQLETAYGRVETGALVLHRDVYVLLAMIALLAMFGPIVYAVVTASSIMNHHGDAEGARHRWHVIGIIGLLVVATIPWVMVVFTSVLRFFRSVWGSWLGGLQYELRRGSFRLDRWLFRIDASARALLVFGGIVYFTLLVGYLLEIWQSGNCPGAGCTPMDSTPFRLFFYRAIDLDSGISPLAAIMIGAAGAVAWASWNFLRVRELRQPTAFEFGVLGPIDKRTLRGPLEEGSARLFRQVRRAVVDLRYSLFVITPRPSALVLLIVIVAVAFGILSQFSRSLEVVAAPSLDRGGLIFDVLLRVSVLGALTATAWAVFRLMNVWKCLRRFLAEIGSSRLLAPLGTLPQQLWQFGSLSLIDQPTRDEVGEVSNRHWQRLCSIWAAQQPRAASWNPVLAEQLSRVTSDIGWCSAGSTTIAERADRLAQVQQHLEEVWSRYPEPASTDAEPIPEPFRAWRDQAERFVSIQVADYIEWSQQHLRRLAIFLLLSMLLATALFSAYPFQPVSLVQLVFTVLMIWAVGALVLMVTQMNRDKVLSTITGSDPGRVSWNAGFLMNLVLFAVLPLLALLSSEYLTMRTAAFAWLQPLLQAFTKF